ncbi:MAG TPA: nuclear transport factor 2 family protein [Verrucomicrobiae bacterium]
MRSPSTDPELVVQRQLDAYNARDLDTLLTIYAENAEMFEHPSKLLASGPAQLRERFSIRFKEPDLHALLRRRIVMGNIVVDHEEVTRNFPEGKGTLELIMIYEVQRGRILKAWSIAGAKTLSPNL